MADDGGLGVGPDRVGIGVADAVGEGSAAVWGLRPSPIREMTITITAITASDTTRMPRKRLVNSLLVSSCPAPRAYGDAAPEALWTTWNWKSAPAGGYSTSTQTGAPAVPSPG